jgi:hypothetical protein
MLGERGRQFFKLFRSLAYYPKSQNEIFCCERENLKLVIYSSSSFIIPQGGHTSAAIKGFKKIIFKTFF